jgi:hypothetical protein
MTSEEDLTNELYRVAHGVSWQCDLTNRIYVQFKETTASFRIQDFFSFQRKVKSINIHEMIYNLSDEFDFELVEAPQNSISMQLTLREIIELRDLLAGTRFVITLNSFLREVLGDAALMY